MKHKRLSFAVMSIVTASMLVACSPAAAPTQEALMTKPPDDMMKPTANAMMAKPTVVMAKPTDDMMMKSTAEAMMEPTKDAMMGKSLAWLATPLTDVNTGQSFQLADFKGKVVLVEGMAAWCTNCLQQQRELVKLHQQIGDQALSVAIDVDLNEDAALLKKHAETNGFNWRYAVATPELAQALAQEFGSSFLNPPTVPMFLLDKDGGVHMLDSGQKSVEYLTKQIAMYQ